MRRKKGKYTPSSRPMGKLNASAKPVRVKSTNQMKRKKSKSFRVSVRASRNPTNRSKKAVSSRTSGRPGAGRTVAGKRQGNWDTRRVDQISPAQFGIKASPTSKTMSSNPRKQNKRPSLNSFKKSIRRSMGYRS